jgi:hypothetical protein
MKNIHVLPTDKPSRLIIYSTLLNEFRLLDKPIDDWKHKRNIYITDDSEIKVGDWYYLPRTNSVHKCIEATELNLERRLGVAKIILTTDPDLIADGVQSIDDEFLQWFVKNPSCKSVEIKDISIEDIIEEWWEDLTNTELIEVYKKTGNFRLGGWSHDIGPTEEDVKDMYLEIHNLNSKQLKANYYRIIIPQEPKPHSFCKTPEEKCTMNYCDENGCLNRKKELEEPKQEIQSYICPQTKIQCDDECCASVEDCHIESSIGILSEPKQENCCTPVGEIKRYVGCVGCDRKPEQTTEKYEQQVLEKYYSELKESNYNGKDEIFWISNNPQCKQIESCYGSLSKKCICVNEELIEETIEKVAKKRWGNVHRTGVLGFIEGANFQAERMYSEEDLKLAWEDGRNGTSVVGSFPFTNTRFTHHSFTKWFNQFKKK